MTANAASPKWKDLVTPGTPLPTPWSKAEFEAMQKEIQARRRKIRAEKRPEEEMEALFREEQQKVDALLAPGAPRARGRRVRGRDLRGDGLLPRRGELHDVHAPHRRSAPPAGAAIERVIDLYARR